MLINLDDAIAVVQNNPNPIEGLKNLPAVKAKWEFVEMGENGMPVYRCPNCNIERYGRGNFCSVCGVRMDGDSNE